MTDQEIIEQLRTQLNKEGRRWGLQYEVSDASRPDGEWTQFYVSHNETRKNSAASRQIIANVESDIIAKAGREIIIILTQRPAEAAGA
jgi:hypothetical protein